VHAAGAKQGANKTGIVSSTELEGLITQIDDASVTAANGDPQQVQLHPSR
jgi:hypothetical protein